MEQILNINMTLHIQIPSEYVLITKEEYENLKHHELLGHTWDMNDVRARLNNVDSRWIKEHILYPNREVLAVENGGFVLYPKASGSKWKFGALKMANYLENHWGEYMCHKKENR